MMRALEEHLAEWARRQLVALGGQSQLFGTLRIVPADQGGPPPLQPGETGLQVSVGDLVPAPEEQGVGPAAGLGDHLLSFTAHAVLRLFGPAKAQADGENGTITPADAHVHRVDLVLLTLLTLLRERQRAGPDGGDPGDIPSGTVVSAEGARRAQLEWQIKAPGPARVEVQGNIRKWEIPLTAACSFRLSPLALEGGRILQVEAAVARSGVPGQMETALYAPAESIALDHFAGLGVGVLVELSSHGITTLGDLSRLGRDAVAALAQGLGTATGDERTVLNQLAEIAEMRKGPVGELASTWLDPRLLALPARALMAPTPAELAVMSQVMLTPQVALAMNVAGAPVAVALRPEHRETVTVGTLLIRGR